MKQTTTLGKLPPQAIDIEKAVLGAILIDKNAINEVSELLKPESFYKTEHQAIYQAITELYEAGQAIDMLTVIQLLRKTEQLELCGGAFAISELSNKVASSANICQHAAILHEKYIKRKLIEYSSKAIELCYEEFSDGFDLLTEHQENLTTLELGHTASTIYAAIQFVPETMNELLCKIQATKEGKKQGIPTFSPLIDSMTGGFIKGGLSVIAGRPGEGKTATLLQAVIRGYQQSHRIGIISLEMSKGKLTERLLSNLAKINAYKLRDGILNDIEYADVLKQAETLMSENIFISDNPYTDEKKLRPLIRQFVKKHKVEIVYIDYFQLIKVRERENKVYANEGLSQTLQKIAREFDIPIVALSQQARNGNARPTMESLRGGGIEQASDLIINLWDQNYQTENVEPKSDMYAIVSKAKHGSCGDVALHYDKTIQMITDGHLPQNYQSQKIDIPKNDLF